MMRRHPNWILAENILARVLGGVHTYELDQIPALASCKWGQFDIEGRDPTFVADDLIQYCAPIVSGILVVVAFESYRSQSGPFFVDAKQFHEFVQSFDDAYDDVLVSGDTVIVSPETGVVVAVHHNGLIATVHGAIDQTQC